MEYISHFLVRLIGVVAIALAVVGCDPVTGTSPSDAAPDPEPEPVTYSISGHVQKGPFVQGTEVTVRELDSSLSPTGRTFTGTIADDTGRFTASGELDSPYAELSATGYYFNEVSGALSSGTLTLRAIVDLSDRTTVNVNLLTHLERERVETLVSGEASLADAKTQAQGEILSIFGISGSSIGDSEDLDIAQAGDANAILLAVSAVLQGDNTEAELTALLSTIAQDLAADGTVSDTGATNEIRQNAMNLDLAAVRSNVEQRYSDLGVTAEVGGFEAFVDSDGDGTVNWEAVSFTGLAPSGPGLVATVSPSLTWDAISGADFVEVQTAGSEAALSSAATVQASGSSHALSVSKGETVYWRIRPHFSVNGGYYGDWSPVQNFTVAAYTVGETGPAGGTIIYVDSAGDHAGWDYMEAAPSYTEWPMDQYAWGAHTQTTGATGTAVGTGASNTATIVAWLNANTDDTYGDVTSKTDRAAYLCDTLTVNNGGNTYSEWFLPSRDELRLMFDAGILSLSAYWSSSESNTHAAFNGSSTETWGIFKSAAQPAIRAARTF